MLNIRKGGHRDLERWYNMFEVDFDERELLPKLGLHTAISKGDAELLIIYDEDSKLELAYALVLCRNVYGYVLLKYFGVLPWYRGKGVGLQAMRMLNKRYAETQGILAEISVFDPEEDDYIEGTIDARQWRSFCPEVPSTVVTNVIYGQVYRPDHMVLQKCGSASGMQELFTFQRERGGWRLTSYEN